MMGTMSENSSSPTTFWEKLEKNVVQTIKVSGIDATYSIFRVQFSCKPSKPTFFFLHFFFAVGAGGTFPNQIGKSWGKEKRVAVVGAMSAAVDPPNSFNKD